MPFNVAESSQVQSENDTSQGVPVEKAVILLVDDNSVNLDIESEILGTYGLQVDTADSGSKAIEYCHSHSPDMIILDLHMPDMDGYETARHIRELPDFGLTAISRSLSDLMI